MKSIRHRRLLLALIVIIVAVLVGLAWLVWPERKDLTVHLRFLGNRARNLESRVLVFRLEGADGYEVVIVPGSVHVCSEVRPHTLDLHTVDPVIADRNTNVISQVSEHLALAIKREQDEDGVVSGLSVEQIAIRLRERRKERQSEANALLQSEIEAATKKIEETRFEPDPEPKRKLAAMNIQNGQSYTWRYKAGGQVTGVLYALHGDTFVLTSPTGQRLSVRIDLLIDEDQQIADKLTHVP